MTIQTFGSVSSGIEAASVAWEPLGWRAAWFSEIAPFPSAVLAHHYPSTPNLGDMCTLPGRIATGEVEAPDLLCGGTPCQAFSVAGLRQSLDDDRGNLSLVFCEIADALDNKRTQAGAPPIVVFWENVPGVLSTKDNAFGCFLAGLAGEDDPLEPPGGRWADAGYVSGPQRDVAWRILDAQYFGLAQRRRRVFVVASARTDFDPAAVLFEFDGVRRDLAPSREARQGVAGTLAGGARQRGGFSHDDIPLTAGTLRSTDGGADLTHAFAGHVVGTLDASYGRLQGCSGQDANHGRSHLLAFGGNNTSGPITVAAALNAAGGSGRMDFETETFITTHTLRGEGFDASEDGTGRGTPPVPVYVPELHPTMVARSSRGGGQTNTPGHNADGTLIAFDTTQVTSATNRSNPQPGDPCHPLAAGAHAPAIAFDCKASGMAGFGVGDVASTMRAMGHAESHQNGGGHLAVAIHAVGLGSDPLHSCDLAMPVTGGNGDPGVIQRGMQVRRLTPVECERLQGFPPITERIILNVCTDPQSGLVSVALQCLRWQNNASPAGGEGLTPFVSSAAVGSSTPQAVRAPLAVLHVVPRSEGDSAELRSHAKSRSDANGVNGLDWYRRSTPSVDSVPLLAHTLRTLAHAIRAGKVASQLFMTPSTAARTGGARVPMSGDATTASADVAATAQTAGTFTTFGLGRLRPNCGSTEATWCCSVLAAIAGCIPNETLPDSFSLELTVVTPYTAIPWRGKPADQCPDGPRYKALGNSWAVPNIRALGVRIILADAGLLP